MFPRGLMIPAVHNGTDGSYADIIAVCPTLTASMD